MKKTVFVSDLDNTLIYSQKKIAAPDVCVEWKDGTALSYMTKQAWEMLLQIKEQLCFVPVTTRSLVQYQRISFPGTVPEYALVSNGGILLVNGEIDWNWYQESKERSKSAGEEIEKAKKILESDCNRIFEIRLIDDLFLFTKSKDIPASFARLQEGLDLDKVMLNQMGQKLYVIPKWMEKGVGLQRLKERMEPSFFLAAGDSSFDLSMLQEADFSIMPAELAESEELIFSDCMEFYHGKDCFFSEKVLEWVWDRIKCQQEDKLENKEAKGRIYFENPKGRCNCTGN